MEKKGPNYHSMQRRMATHNYTLPGIYHITLHVAEGMGQPLGLVEGSLEQPDGTPSGPHVALTPIGQMVREELLSSITAHYSMINVDTFVIMPEHLHVLLQVTAPIVSSNGRPTHLGQVIAGYKKGCNRRFWAMTGQDISAGEPLNTRNALRVPSGSPAGFSSPAGISSPAGVNSPAGISSPAGINSPSGNEKRVPSYGTTARPPLFATGYCDVQPITAEQLETQRAYIHGNPRSRLLRTSLRATLMPSRGAFVTALTPAALRKYLQSVCLPQHATPEALAAIEQRLLLTASAPTGTPATSAPSASPATSAPSASPATSAPSASPATSAPSASPAIRVPSGSPATSAPSASPAIRVPSASPAIRVPSASPAIRVPSGSPAGISTPFVTLDTYGNRQLLNSHLLPVVCHYKDRGRFAQQKARCLEEAAHGAVLVSARIAPGEQEIMNEAVNHGFPTITISDNGFPERYHPSAERIDRCAAGQLLIVTPWQYQYRGKNELVTIPFCKTMNCVAQALCHQKDDWWKNSE